MVPTDPNHKARIYAYICRQCTNNDELNKHIRTYVHTYIHTYIHTYTHTHTHTRQHNKNANITLELSTDEAHKLTSSLCNIYYPFPFLVFLCLFNLVFSKQHYTNKTFPLFLLLIDIFLSKLFFSF